MKHSTILFLVICSLMAFSYVSASDRFLAQDSAVEAEQTEVIAPADANSTVVAPNITANGTAPRPRGGRGPQRRHPRRPRHPVNGTLPRPNNTNSTNVTAEVEPARLLQDNNATQAAANDSIAARNTTHAVRPRGAPSIADINRDAQGRNGPRRQGGDRRRGGPGNRRPVHHGEDGFNGELRLDHPRNATANETARLLQNKRQGGGRRGHGERRPAFHHGEHGFNGEHHFGGEQPNNATEATPAARLLKNKRRGGGRRGRGQRRPAHLGEDGFNGEFGLNAEGALNN